jgi:hypothetical protein
VGLDDGELSLRGGVVACSPSEGVVAEEEAEGGSLAGCRCAPGEGVLNEFGLEVCLGREGLLLKASLFGDGDVGVGVLESLCGAESWVINERTWTQSANRLGLSPGSSASLYTSNHSKFRSFFRTRTQPSQTQCMIAPAARPLHASASCAPSVWNSVAGETEMPHTSISTHGGVLGAPPSPRRKAAWQAGRSLTMRSCTAEARTQQTTNRPQPELFRDAPWCTGQDRASIETTGCCVHDLFSVPGARFSGPRHSCAGYRSIRTR